MLDTGIRADRSQHAVRELEAEYANDCQLRSGAHALSLFSTTLHGLVLKALASHPMRLTDLRRAVGGPAQTTLRGNLRNLIEIGALEKQQDNGRGGLVNHVLTPLGSELLLVADALEAWLSRSPHGPIRSDSETGKAAVKALVGGWESTMLRALAARPFSLTALDNLITSFSYPALERRLGAMRLAGCVEPVEGNGGGTPYAVTKWLRLGMAPLLAAIRCERRHMALATAPLTRIDIEAMLLLSIPLATPGRRASGTAQLAVYGGDGSERRAAGVCLTVRDGRLTGFTSKLEPRPENLIRGSAMDWLDALVDGRSAQLEVAGEPALTLDVVHGLHRALFPA